MKRIYMDISEELHLKYKQEAKHRKQTLKGFLESIVEGTLIQENRVLEYKKSNRKVVKKNDRKSQKKS